jgi:hypothetical protein
MKLAIFGSPAPTAKSGRNAFVRTKVSRLERTLSVGIVGLLGVIAAVIGIAGRNYDASRYALRVDALKTTAAAVEGKLGTVRAPDAAPGETTAGAALSPPAADKVPEGEPAGETARSQGEPGSAMTKGEPLEAAIAGLKPMAPTEFYSPNNLYEKIDGRAPAYLGFNFRQLRCRSFGAAGGSFVDVFEFRMNSPLDAFGIFSLERDPQGKPLDFAPDGYAGEMGFFFRQGACYVQVIASDTKPPTMTLARALAQDRAKALPADDTGLAARRRLPATGLVADSVSFVPENALGQAGLKNVFQAAYQFEGTKVQFFLMAGETAEAETAWKAFRDFCGRFGGKVTVASQVNGADFFLAQSFGTWKAVYRRGGEVGGVYDADDADRARRFVNKYLRGEIR